MAGFTDEQLQQLTDLFESQDQRLVTELDRRFVEEREFTKQFIDRRFVEEREFTKQFIDRRFVEERATTKELLNARFIDERTTTKELLRSELSSIRQALEGLERRTDDSEKEILLEIEAMKVRLAKAEQTLAEIQES